jgi:dolichol-phosphate mannosyltransferase
LTAQPRVAYGKSTATCELSLVVPAHNEEASLPHLYQRLTAVLDSVGLSAELIIVDDGSSDQTWRVVGTLHARDPRVRGIQLSRNFGHQFGLLAGLVQSRGRAVVTLDADLQHPPELLPQLIEAWRAGAKIVHTVRIDAPDTSLWKRVTSRLFYRIFSLLSGVKLESGVADYRLIDRQVLESLLAFGEEGLFLRGIVHWVGFPSARIEYRAEPRFAGTSKYTFGRMLRFARAGMLSFSIIPLRLSIVLGVVTAGLAFAELLYAFSIKLFSDKAVPGWASAVSVVSLLFGILFILLGVLGEYLGQILLEVKRRPRFLVNDSVGLGEVRPDPRAARVRNPSDG